MGHEIHLLVRALLLGLRDLLDWAWTSPARRGPGNRNSFALCFAHYDGRACPTRSRSERSASDFSAYSGLVRWQGCIGRTNRGGSF